MHFWGRLIGAAATVYKWNQTPPVVINHNEENLPRSGEKGSQVSKVIKQC